MLTLKKAISADGIYALPNNIPVIFVSLKKKTQTPKFHQYDNLT